MPSRFDTALANEWARAFAEFIEPVKRRPHGVARDAETVDCVIERDSRAAGTDTNRGGVRQTDGRNQVERSCLIEVAASQEVTPGDLWFFDGVWWKTTGDVVGSDGGSKTFRVVRTQAVTGRKSLVNRTEQ